LLTTVMLGGCMTAAKEALHTVRGGQGKVLEIKSAGSLAAYDSFTVEPVRNELGGIVPADLLSLIPERIAERVGAETRLNSAGEKTLTIRSTLVYCDLKGLGSGMVSPLEEVVCHVELLDPSGSAVGWAAIAGRSESRIRGATQGVYDLADGLAKGVVTWLKENNVPARE